MLPNACLTALHPDSASKIRVYVDSDLVVDEWEGTPGSGEMEEIPGLEGLTGARLEIQGVIGTGDYFAILEVIDLVWLSSVGVATKMPHSFPSHFCFLVICRLFFAAAQLTF